MTDYLTFYLIVKYGTYAEKPVTTYVENVMSNKKIETQVLIHQAKKQNVMSLQKPPL
jgi:hypothetical protein